MRKNLRDDDADEGPRALFQGNVLVQLSSLWFNGHRSDSTVITLPQRSPRWPSRHNSDRTATMIQRLPFWSFGHHANPTSTTLFHISTVLTLIQRSFVTLVQRPLASHASIARAKSAFSDSVSLDQRLITLIQRPSPLVQHDPTVIPHSGPAGIGLAASTA